MTAVYITRDRDLLGVIAIADAPRPEAAAAHVAGAVGEAHARGEHVIMVGDGVNDAPALASASTTSPTPGSSPGGPLRRCARTPSLPWARW